MKKSARKIFSENLKKYMKRNDIDQKDLAEAIGVSQSSISQWLNENKYPRIDKIELVADYFGVYKSQLTSEEAENIKPLHKTDIKQIPVLSQVSAGMPIYAEENVIDHTYVAESLLKDGKEYFGLIVDGDSMDKEFRNGDIVIIEKTACLENGQIGVVQINGYNATLKRIKYVNDSILLMPESANPKHEPQIYDKDDELTIIGKVVGLNRRY